MLHRATSYFGESPWAIAYNRLTKGVGTHALPEGIHSHGLFRGTGFHHLGPEAVDVLFQTLSLVLLHVKYVIGDWQRGPVRQVLLSEQL